METISRLLPGNWQKKGGIEQFETYLFLYLAYLYT